MKLQKQPNKVNGKLYHKYVLVIPEDLVKQAGFKEGEELKGVAEKGEIKLKNKIKT